MSETVGTGISTAGSVENWESLSEPIAWRPSADYLQRSRLRRFMERHGITDYPTLLRRAGAIHPGFGMPSPPNWTLSGSAPYADVEHLARPPQHARHAG